jgi:hypothetical protein
MQRINRILAFASVSFVLIFIAKINKVGLYTAYFKTIAEVEVRNSQDVAPEDLLKSQDFGMEAEPKTLSGPGHATPDLSESAPVLADIPLSILPFYSRSTVFVPKRQFFRAVAPRAPTA